MSTKNTSEELRLRLCKARAKIIRTRGVPTKIRRKYDIKKEQYFDFLLDQPNMPVVIFFFDQHEYPFEYLLPKKCYFLLEYQKGELEIVKPYTQIEDFKAYIGLRYFSIRRWAALPSIETKQNLNEEILSRLQSGS